MFLFHLFIIFMFLSEEICEKHNLNTLFVCEILMFMTWIAESKSDFDINHLEKYDILKDFYEKYDSYDFENLSEKEEEKIWDEMRSHIKAAGIDARRFHNIAESITDNTTKKKYVSLIAKKQQINRENFLKILQCENPNLDIQAFTDDCKENLIENPDPLFEKLLKNYQKKK